MFSSKAFSWVTLLCLVLAVISQASVITRREDDVQSLSSVNATVDDAPDGLRKGKGGKFPALINATIEDVADGLAKGDFTTVQLVQAYLARIGEVQELNAVTEINPDALEIAKFLDEERKKGKNKGKPLHGIPILIKNNIATNDKMNNTAGSFALVGAKVKRDSTIASKLRAAGVVILGKTNLSQWANFRSSNSSNGWSAQGGQVRGAYTKDQDPSGSSSGSAVAASLGLCMAALGTETSGSILSPSENAALVGIKPTVGLTSRDLVIPINQHQDTVGPMARTVRDAAYVLAAIAGTDKNDNYTSAIPFKGIPDYVKACKKSGLQGQRIGVVRNFLFSDPTTHAALAEFEKAIDIIRKAGATIVENANYSRLDEFLNSPAEGTVLSADFVTNLPQYLSQLTANPQNVKNLTDVRTFTVTTPKEEYPDRDVSVWDQALALGFDNTDPRFWAAYQELLALAGPGGVTGALDKDNLDALILPTAFAPPLPAALGTPVITVPLGFEPDTQPPTQQVLRNSPRGDLVIAAPNIPFGISFIGRAFSEEKLIGHAYAFEQRTKARDLVQPIVQAKTEITTVKDWKDDHN